MSLTSQIRYIVALDSTATNGAGKTGLAFGDFTAKYLTLGGTLATLTTETITTLGTYQAPTDAAHIRIKEVNSADPTKGVYEVHFHNTQIASSGQFLWLFLSATGAAIAPLEMDLMTKPAIDAIPTTTPLTAAQIATGIFQDTTAGDFTVANSIGKSIMNGVALGTGLTVNDLTKIGGTAQTGGDIYGKISASTFPAGTLSTLTQTQVTGGAYPISDASFAFNSGLDFTTTQKAATLARVTLTDTITTYTGNTPQTGDVYGALPVNFGSLTLTASQTVAATGDAMTLTSGERNAIAAALLDLANGVETSITVRKALRAIVAGIAGKRSNCGTTSEQYDAAGNPGTARIVGNLDSDGNGTPTLTL